MAGGDEFSSFLSDTEDGDSEEDRAVEDLLSQAMDLSLLDQIAAINCSSDNLPYHLLNRFRKLKSLPPPPPSSDLSTHDTHHHKHKPPTPTKPYSSSSLSLSQSSFIIPDDTSSSIPSTANRINTSKLHSSPPPSSSSSFISTSDFCTLSSSDSRSVSPVRRGIACFWCSSKNNNKKKQKQKQKQKERRKGGKENRLSSSSSGEINVNDVDFLKSFSVKEQKKIMRKAIKAEEKINREADKIVKWAKQAAASSSSRMMDHHHVSGVVVVDDPLEDTTRKT